MRLWGWNGFKKRLERSKSSPAPHGDAGKLPAAVDCLSAAVTKILGLRLAAEAR